MRSRLSKKFDKIATAASNSNGIRRQITDDFQYDKKKVKHIQFVLHNVNVSLGALVSALSRFSKIKGPSISPDGLLGGLGYIMSIKDIKQAVNQIVRDLSDIQDTLADELTNPRWNVSTSPETKKLLKEKEEVEEKVEKIDENDDLSPKDILTSDEHVASEDYASRIFATEVKQEFGEPCEKQYDKALEAMKYLAKYHDLNDLLEALKNDVSKKATNKTAGDKSEKLEKYLLDAVSKNLIEFGKV